jgi:hypothetical protein
MSKFESTSPREVWYLPNSIPSLEADDTNSCSPAQFPLPRAVALKVSRWSATSTEKSDMSLTNDPYSSRSPSDVDKIHREVADLQGELYILESRTRALRSRLSELQHQIAVAKGA